MMKKQPTGNIGISWDDLKNGNYSKPKKRTRKQWNEAGYTVITKRKGLLFDRTEVRINKHV